MEHLEHVAARARSNHRECAFGICVWGDFAACQYARSLLHEHDRANALESRLTAPSVCPVCNTGFETSDGKRCGQELVGQIKELESQLAARDARILKLRTCLEDYDCLDAAQAIVADNKARSEEK